MLEATLTEARTLKKFLRVIGELVDDAVFRCTSDGIVVQTLDSRHVALVTAKFPPVAFDLYRCDTPLSLGFSVFYLTKVLKCAADSDICTLRATEEGHSLSIVFDSTKSNAKSEYTVKLLGIDEDTLKIPDTIYEASFVISASTFSRVIRNLAQLTQNVCVKVCREGVYFDIKDDAVSASVFIHDAMELGIEDTQSEEESGVLIDITNTEVSTEGTKRKLSAVSQVQSVATEPKRRRLLKHDPVVDSVKVLYMKKEVSLLYSLDYLVKISKSIGAPGNITIAMSNTAPIRVECNFQQVTVQFHVAALECEY